MESFNFNKPPEATPSQERTPVKDGVVNVFEKHPELLALGTPEEYSRYLDTIFPESKLHEIVYHGTASQDKIEAFDFKKSNYAQAVFFTKNKAFAESFAFDDVRNGSVQEQMLDIKNTFDFSNPEHVAGLREIIAELVREGYKSSTGIRFHNNLPEITIGEKTIQNPTLEDFVEHYMWRLNHGSWRIIETDRIVDFISKKYDSIQIVERGNTNIAVFSGNQIHVLGSAADIEKFKSFTHKDTPGK